MLFMSQQSEVYMIPSVKEGGGRGRGASWVVGCGILVSKDRSPPLGGVCVCGMCVCVSGVALFFAFWN